MVVRRLTLTGLTALCALVATLSIASAPALAASEEHPYLSSKSLVGKFAESSARGIATDAYGDLYVTNYKSDKVVVYSSADSKLTEFTTPTVTNHGPTYLAVNASGDVYVGYDTSEVLEYKPSEFQPTTSTTYALDETAGTNGVIVPESGAARAIVVDPASEDLYVAEGTHIAEYGSGGTLISATIAEGLIAEPDYTGVGVYGANGDIYVSDEKHARVYVLKPGGSAILATIDFTAGLTLPNLAVDQATGDVYVFAAGSGGQQVTDSVVTEFSAAGHYISKIGHEFDSSLHLDDIPPSSVVVDNGSKSPNAGDIYVTSVEGTKNSVYAFGPLGTVTKDPLSPVETGRKSGTVVCEIARTVEETCAGEYPEGTMLALLGTPSGAGATFTGWSDGSGSAAGCTGTGPCEFTIAASTGVTATFEPAFPLEVENKGTGAGELTSTPSGIECESPGCTHQTHEFVEGSRIVMVAAPKEPKSPSGSKFAGWTGCTPLPDPDECEVTMSEARKVTATFNLKAATEYPLEVIKTGAGKGTVASTPAEIVCGGTCSAEFPQGEKVKLEATPEAGYEFAGWKDCEAEPGGECEVTMTAAKKVEAKFEPEAVTKYTLKIKKTGTGTGTVECEIEGSATTGACAASYPEGTKLVLKETPGLDSTFGGWSEACSDAGTESECKLIMSADESVTAEFNEVFVPKDTLTITKTGTGTGKVECEVNSSGSFGTCAAEYAEGTKLVVKGTAEPGSTFAGWSSGTGSAGSCTGTGNCSFTITADSALTAPFNLIPKDTLTLTKTGTGTGKVECEANSGGSFGTCAAEYAEGTKLVVKAIAESGSTFAGWSGTGSAASCTGTGNCSFTITADSTLTAPFNLIPKYTLTVTKTGTGKGTVECEVNSSGSFGACAAEYAEGTKLVVKGTAEPGSTFAGWSSGTGSAGSCTGTGNCSFTITADSALTAPFTLIPKDTLTITKTGTGTGEVECEVNGSGTFVPCVSEYNEGTKLVVKATPESGSTFAGWSSGTGSAGSCTGTGNCSFTITADSALTAPFNTTPITKDKLSITKNGTGTGEVDCEVNGSGSFGPCATEYPEGTKLVLKGTAGSGSTFAGWSSGSGSASSCTGTTNCPFTITANSALTATFNLTVITKEGRLTVSGQAPVSGEDALLKLSCSAAGACAGNLKLTIRVRRGRKTKTVVIGQGSYSLAAGQSETLKVRLSGFALQLVKRFKTLDARLTGPGGLNQTVKLQVQRHHHKHGLGGYGQAGKRAR